MKINKREYELAHRIAKDDRYMKERVFSGAQKARGKKKRDKTLREKAEEIGVAPYATVLRRVRPREKGGLGWDEERALYTPPMTRQEIAAASSRAKEIHAEATTSGTCTDEG